MLDVNGSTGKGRDEVNLALIEKVIVLAGEAGMGLLLNLKHNVSGLDAGGLVTLTAELDLGAAADTTVDVDVEDLPIDNGLLAVALLAPILLLDDLTLAVAVGAHGLESLDHGAHLAHHGLHAMAITSRATPHGALLAANSVTLGADDGPLERKLGNLALVDIFEGDLVGMVDSACLGRTPVLHAAEHASKTATETAATSTEELCEEVLGSHTATCSTALEAGLTILVVDRSLLGIGQDFVSGGDFLEFVLGGGVVGIFV